MKKKRGRPKKDRLHEINEELNKAEKPKEKRIIAEFFGKFKRDKELPEVADGHVEEKKKHKGLSWWDKRKLKKKPEHSYLVRMFFSNGTSKEFVIYTKHECFTYKGRTYYLKYTDAWFNLTQNQFELNFFDDCAVPIDREIKMEGDKKYWSVTPENLKPIIDMNYVKVLASSQELDKYLRMSATLNLVTSFLCLILIYFGWKTSRGITLLLQNLIK